ncbi:hypothetical protein SLA2020_185350 [Shorea laevis]
MASMFDMALRFLSTSVSLAGILMLIRSLVSDVILDKLRSYFSFFFNYLLSFFRYLLTCFSTNLTLVINEKLNMSRNELYDAAELYLPTKIGPKTKRLRLGKIERQEKFAISLDNGEEVVDIFEGTQLKWRYKCDRKQTHPNGSVQEEKYFELSFRNKFKDQVVDVYLPHVLARAEQIKEETRVVKIYSFDPDRRCWTSTPLEHPATFDTVAMALELKKMIIDDLERFRSRRAFFKKVGKAWKRGYLLYGPPGTGKSSLIAAMANYLKFDIYDLELESIKSNSNLRKSLLSTTSRSILVIEDIDCGIEVQDRKIQSESDNSKLTLSGILNLIDGLWSSCGDERIIVFTTNHKDRLDPALLRPGRMDEHINLSYCKVDEFRILASNYLDISNRDHPRFGEIESLIQSTEVTPAEVAGKLMRSEDADFALQGLIDFLKHKSKCDKIEEEIAEIEESNSFKSDNEEKEISVRRTRRGESGWQHEDGEEREGQGID